jgi:hypothetical protein
MERRDAERRERSEDKKDCDREQDDSHAVSINERPGTGPGLRQLRG